MVCEPPRLRSLFVRRRGQFFEDPFFRDAWGDYSSAVRRIVDRFNHGFVSPAERIRDSQYHSMYRTLRTARINYSTPSARFKEEGNIYKLVMDVHEFIGGDITVRTAGSTVSVRGKVEAGADCTNGTTLTTEERKDDDASSTSSGTSFSSKTLHRRFTLPSDADCEKVESTLSKDAFLTVIISKRADVRYIPVTIEGETKRIEEDVPTRYGGIKRPSDSKMESSRKKPQEDLIHWRKNNFIDENKGWRERLENLRQNDDNKHLGTNRRSRYDTYYDKEYKNGHDEGKRTHPNARTANVDVNDATDMYDANEQRRCRRREKKYEDVHEIKIQVPLNRRENADKVYRPKSYNELKVRDIEIKTDRPKSTGDQCQNNYVRVDDDREAERINGPDACRDGVLLSNRLNRKRTIPQDDTNEILSLSKFSHVSKDEEPENKSKICPLIAAGSLNDKENRAPDFDVMNEVLKIVEPEDENKKNMEDYQKLKYKPIDLNSIYTIPDSRYEETMKKDPTIENPLFDEIKEKMKEIPLSNSESSGSESIEDKLKLSGDSTLPLNNKEEYKREEEEKALKDDASITSGQNAFKNDLTVETLSVEGSKIKTPPPSPGGREVKIEKGQLCMEDDMFKDCWNDFSNTLQEVLNRLQELSSELGHSKLLATPATDEKLEEDTEKKKLIVTPTEAIASRMCKKGELATKEWAEEEEEEKVEAPEVYDETHGGQTCESLNRETFVNSGQGVKLEEGSDSDDTKESVNSSDSVDATDASDDGDVSSSPSRGSTTSPIDVLTRDLRAKRSINNSITQWTPPPNSGSTSPCKETHLPSDESGAKNRNVTEDSLRNSFAPAGERSDSLTEAKRDIATINGVFARKIPRPTTLFLGQNAENSLLPGLRKNSPVEALQEKFLRRSCHTPSPSSEGYKIPVEVESSEETNPVNSVAAGSFDATRSPENRGLSPRASTSSGTKDESPDDSDRYSREDDTKNKVRVEYPSDNEEDIQSSDECESPQTVSVCDNEVIDITDKKDDHKKRQSELLVKDSVLEGGDKLGKPFRNLSDLNDKSFLKLNTKDSLKPNINKLTIDLPNSNLGCESESYSSIDSDEGVVTGKLSIPLSAFSHPAPPVTVKNIGNQSLEIEEVKDNRRTPKSKDCSSEVINRCDVIDCNDDTRSDNTSTDLEIPSNDVMGGEHQLPQTYSAVGRRAEKSTPLSPAKIESSSRFGSSERHRSSASSSQDRCDAYNSRTPRREMGGVFSRGKPSGYARSSDSPPVSPLSKSPPGSVTQHYPYRTAARSRERAASAATASASASGATTPIVPPEPPVPSYVRQRSEPSRRYSGFAHVTSDNVRRMRDGWVTRNDKKPEYQPSSTPPLSPFHRMPTQVPPSPTRTTSSRRTSEASTDSQQYRKSSPVIFNYPRVQQPSTTEKARTQSSYRKRSPSPTLSHGRVASVSPTRNRTSSNNARTPFQNYVKNNTPTPYISPLTSSGSFRGNRRSPSPRNDRFKTPTERKKSPTPPPCSRKCSGGGYKENISTSSPSARRRNRDQSKDKISADRTSRPESMPTKLNHHHNQHQQQQKQKQSSPPPTSSGHRANGPAPSISRTKSSTAADPSSKASKAHHQRIFKRFRNANLQPDSEAICFKEEEDKYTMVLDVEEFVSGEIEVLQDDKVLTVKGRVEAKESGNHVSVKTFNRTFNIPRNTREEDIDSALSEDGILTIFVPKKERVIKIELVD